MPTAGKARWRQLREAGLGRPFPPGPCPGLVQLHQAHAQLSPGPIPGVPVVARKQACSRPRAWPGSEGSALAGPLAAFPRTWGSFALGFLSKGTRAALVRS